MRLLLKPDLKKYGICHVCYNTSNGTENASKQYSTVKNDLASCILHLLSNGKIDDVIRWFKEKVGKMPGLSVKSKSEIKIPEKTPELDFECGMCGSTERIHKLSDRYCDECLVKSVRDVLIEHECVPKFQISDKGKNDYVT